MGERMGSGGLLDVRVMLVVALVSARGVPG
jgi:hypothetical protein